MSGHKEQSDPRVALFVADTPSVRRLVARFLVRFGYWALTAATAVEAIGILNEYEGNVELVVSDLSMPRLGGRTLLAVLRRDYPEIGVIMMSKGVTTEAMRGFYPDADSVQFLAKPFSIADLAAALLALGQAEAPRSAV